MQNDVIEGHAIAIHNEPAPVAVREKPHSLAMLDATTPEEYMERIARVCKILVDVVEKQRLAKKLGRGDKKHVELEAWQFLGSMPWIRCAAIIEWTKEVGGDGSGLGWEARAQVYRDGVLVGAGDGMCLRSESNWKAPKDYFALRSMAQSRAMSRALQGPLRFIFVLAGYAGAGAEEMAPEATEPPRKDVPPPEPRRPRTCAHTCAPPAVPNGALEPAARSATRDDASGSSPGRRAQGGTSTAAPIADDPVRKGNALEACRAARRKYFFSDALYAQMLLDLFPQHASPVTNTVSEADLSIDDLALFWKALERKGRAVHQAAAQRDANLHEEEPL